MMPASDGTDDALRSAAQRVRDCQASIKQTMNGGEEKAVRRALRKAKLKYSQAQKLHQAARP